MSSSLPPSAPLAVAHSIEGGWQPIESADLGRMFGHSEWVLIATNDGRVTEALPTHTGAGWVWACARGENVADPRHPSPYLRLHATHWMRLPPLPGEALPAELGGGGSEPNLSPREADNPRIAVLEGALREARRILKQEGETFFRCDCCGFQHDDHPQNLDLYSMLMERFDAALASTGGSDGG